MTWALSSLAEVAEIRSGGTPRRSRAECYGGGIPWARIRDLNVSDGVVRQTEETLSQAGVDAIRGRIFRPGTVLLAMYGSVGKVAVTGIELTTNQAILGINARDQQILDHSFLKYWLNYLRPDLERRAQGVTQRNLSAAIVGKLRIPTPPLCEQRRIVEILDQADHLCHLRTKAEKISQRILPALFLEMFGDPVTNPMGWPIHTLGELSTLGPQYGANARSAPLSDGQPRYVRITDIQEGGSLSNAPVAIDLADWEQYRLRDGDILLAQSGATVGKPYIHRRQDGSCVFAGCLIRFRLDESRLHPLVAFAFTQTPAYRRWVESKRRTAAQPNINGQEFASLRIPVPDRQLQGQFVGLYRRLTRALGKSQRATLALDRLFAILLSRGFSGALTASWRSQHTVELLQEMERQKGVSGGAGT